MEDDMKLVYENFIYEILDNINPKTEADFRKLSEQLHNSIEATIHEYILEQEDKNIIKNFN